MELDPYNCVCPAMVNIPFKNPVCDTVQHQNLMCICIVLLLRHTTIKKNSPTSWAIGRIGILPHHRTVVKLPLKNSHMHIVILNITAVLVAVACCTSIPPIRKICPNYSTTFWFVLRTDTQTKAKRNVLGGCVHCLISFIT